MPVNNIDIFEELNDTYLAIPYNFNPDSNNCCVNFLTSWNYLWTTDVTLVSKDKKINPYLIIYGGGRQPVKYHTLVEESDNLIKFIGDLGEETDTEFERIYLNIDRFKYSDKNLSVYKYSAIMMTYNRYGAQSKFILIKDTFKNPNVLKIIRQEYETKSILCGFPCLRSYKDGNIEKREVYDHNVFGKMVKDIK